jgi:lysozyme
VQLGPVVEIAEPFIARWEGLARLRSDGLIVPYLCPAGFWTQGYGRLVSGATAPPITRDTARLWLFQDILSHAAQAILASPTLAHEPPQRVAVITSFVFNLGITRYRASTLKRRVDAGRWDDVPAQLRRWVFAGGEKLPGLIARREAEAAMLATV